MREQIDLPGDEMELKERIVVGKRAIEQRLEIHAEPDGVYQLVAPRGNGIGVDPQDVHRTGALNAKMSVVVDGESRLLTDG